MAGTDVGTPTTETRTKGKKSVLNGKPTPGKDGASTGGRAQGDPDTLKAMHDMLTSITTSKKPNTNARTLTKIAAKAGAAANSAAHPGTMNFSPADSGSDKHVEDRRPVDPTVYADGTPAPPLKKRKR